MQHLLEQTPEQLQAWLAQRQAPGYRAAQVWRWLFEKGAESFGQMTDLPVALRQELEQAFFIWSAQVAAQRTAQDGTQKLLLELSDRQRIECVLLADDREHHTACISTQVGCAMGCVFCASGLDGVARNLTTGEILEQLLQLRRRLKPNERLSHVVVMGMGEPLANLPNLLPALAVASSRKGLGISARRITISTVGLPPAIRRLAESNCQYHLAISLHAPDDDVRNQIVPANRKTGIAAILAAADDYFRQTKRRVTFEYVLLAGVNDQPQHAERLASLLAGRPALLNLIPYNPVHGLPYQTPSSGATARFVDLLAKGGVNVAIRYRKGERIDAACGQLRRQAASGVSQEENASGQT